MRAEAIGRQQLESDAFRIKPVGLKRWVKAVTVVYGDCNEDIELSKHRSTVGLRRPGTL
jgi:hypothetical protein